MEIRFILSHLTSNTAPKPSNAQVAGSGAGVTVNAVTIPTVSCSNEYCAEVADALNS